MQIYPYTVGPFYIDGKYNEVQLLYQTYQNVLKLALENDVKTIAFPLISAGSHRFPKQLAIEVATVSINEFLETHDMKVYMVLFNKDTYDQVIDSKYNNVLKYIVKNFVDEEINQLRTEFKSSTLETPKKVYKEHSKSYIDTAPTLANEHQRKFSYPIAKIMYDNNLRNKDVYYHANIDKKLFSKIYSGNHPSKKNSNLNYTRT